MIVPVRLNPPAVSYDIHLNPLPKLDFDTKTAIITNPTVSKLHLETVRSKISAPQLEIIEVPDGESYKTIDTVMQILDRLFQARFDRKSILIALGGGVIGDMTGFCASIYQRGIDFIQIPTTLLSQVDASVGGKTGVNNRYGKNLIGSFYQPQAVYIDIDFLQTLPPREFSAGIAEMIKMAVMFDKDYFEFLEKHDIRKDRTALQLAVKRSIELKANVVKQDEKEQGVRAVLNYGHTFAHVIETITEYKRYLHGEAVAIGIVMANVLSSKLNLLTDQESERIKSLLAKYDLPVYFRIDDIEDFYEHFFLDKKTQKGKLSFILPRSIGSHRIEKAITKELIMKTLSMFQGTQL